MLAESEGLPLQVSLWPTRFWPFCGVPVIVGGDVLSGAAAIAVAPAPAPRLSTRIGLPRPGGPVSRAGVVTGRTWFGSEEMGVMRGGSASLAAGAFLLVVLVGPGRADGGFTSVSWGACTVALSVFALAVLVSSEVRIGRLEVFAVSAFALFTAWTALSLLWTSSLPLSVLEVEHTLLPLAVLVAAVVCVRTEAAWILAVVVFVFALAAACRALIAGVDVPVGYANALALLCVIGILLSAGWALERRDLLAVAVLPALCVFVAVIDRTGSRGAWLALLGGVAVGLGLRSRWPTLGTLGALAVSGATVAVVATRASEQRSAYWGATLHEIARHPLLGSGAGTWKRVWLEHRHVDFAAQNAHSLYLEVLSEVGPVGLVLILVGLLVPLVAAVRVRRQPRVPTLAAAYAAFLIHLGVDWDWQISAVLMSGVFLGVALLGVARATTEPGAVTIVPRAATASALLALAVLGTVIWAGGVFTSRAAEHLRSAQWESALSDAGRAHRLAPWSSEPWRLRGEAQLAEGHRDEALASFRRGLELDRNDVVLWRVLSAVATGAELRRARERVAQLDPRGPEGTGATG